MALLAAAAACLLAFALQGHTLWTPMLITDDVAQHHVWLEAGEGSGFMPDDPWIDASKVIQPYLVAAVSKALRLVLPTLLVGKVIALLVLALTGYLLFAIGSRLGGVRLGYVTMGLFFISDAWIGMSGGFARSFAWPLVCGFLLAMLHERRGLAAVCLFLSAALYPILFVLLCPAYVLIWLAGTTMAGGRQIFNMRAHVRLQWPLLLAVVAGSALVLLKSREIGMHPHLGPQVTYEQIMQDPLYGPGGRVPLRPPPVLHIAFPWTLVPWDKAFLEPIMRHSGAMPPLLKSVLRVGIPALAVVVLTLAIVLVWRRRRADAVIVVALVVASVVTFKLAELLLPKLYESSRYLGWSLPVLAVLAWAVVVDRAIGLLRPGRVRQVAIVLLGLVILSRAPTIRGKGAEDMSEYAPLYAALVGTGGEELIACFPRTGDLVPVLSHRSIFISHEASHAVLFSRYRDLVMQRQTAQLKAFYSAQEADVRAFCKDNNISWLVVEEKYYRQDIPPAVNFAPFDELMRAMLKQNPEPWLLAHAKKSGKQVQPGVYLLSTRSMIETSSPLQP